VFFTGGDQLRLTSQVGDTPIYQALRALYDDGGTIVGTSAGAAAMPETMLIGGPSDESLRQGELQMAPGLGLVPNLVVDSHFAERGRIGRLLAAVAQNPRNLGVGIDEDTAIIVKQGCFRVIGSGAVYVADGSTVTFSSLADQSSDEIIHIHDVCLHVLGQGAIYDLSERRPMPLKEEAVQQAS
jgi:cyanophycinase